MKRLKLFKVILALCLCLMCCSAVYAEGDGGDNGGDPIIIEYHDYYVPWVAGMDNCYGAYRIVSSRGTQNLSLINMRKDLSPSKNKNGFLAPLADNQRGSVKTDFVHMYSDSRELKKDDIIVFTRFDSQACYREIVWDGNTEYINTFYYEVPYAMMGYTTAMSPVTGADSSNFSKGKCWVCALNLDIVKRYTSDYKSVMNLMLNYDGQNPIRSGRGHVIKTASPGFDRRSALSSFKEKVKNISNVYYLNRGKYYASSSNTRVVGMNYYVHMVELYNIAKNKDMVGFWDLFILEQLNSIEDFNKNNLADPIETKGLGAGVPVSGDVAAALSTGSSWKTAEVAYNVSTLTDYAYAGSLCKTGKGSGVLGTVWYYNGTLPTQEELNTLWEASAAKVAQPVSDRYNKAADKSTVNPNIQVPKRNVTDMFVSYTPGSWTPAYMRPFANQSMILYTEDPDILGFFPYSRAQNILYSKGYTEYPTASTLYDSSRYYTGKNTETIRAEDSGSYKTACSKEEARNEEIRKYRKQTSRKSMVGTYKFIKDFQNDCDTYTSLQIFLNTGKLSYNTDYNAAFGNKMNNAPFKGSYFYGGNKNSYNYGFYGKGKTPDFSVMWNDPWLPTDSASSSSIWRLWYSNNKDLYKRIVPTMSLRQGLTLWNLDTSTFWNKGVLRNWNPKLVDSQINNINTSVSYSTSAQNEIRNRAQQSAYKNKATSYSQVAINAFARGENKGNFDKTINLSSGNTSDVGSAKINGINYEACYDIGSIRYFPFNIYSLTKLHNTYLGSVITELNNNATDQNKIKFRNEYGTLWKIFPLPQSKESGVFLKPTNWY